MRTIDTAKLEYKTVIKLRKLAPISSTLKDAVVKTSF